MKIKLQHNAFSLWIIVPTENDHLAWNGTRWIPIDRHGMPVDGVEALSFASASEAVIYAEKVGFEIEHG